MCGKFALMTPGKDLAERFGLEEEPALEPRSGDNVKQKKPKLHGGCAGMVRLGSFL
jgi:hypothetical protein